MNCVSPHLGPVLPESNKASPAQSMAQLFYAICGAIVFCAVTFGAGPSRAAAPAPAPAPVPFRDCLQCPEMIVVPPGSFIQGSSKAEGRLNSNEGPQRKVTIAKPFAVAINVVTFDEWYACITDAGCGSYWPDDHEWGRGKRPVINVSWDEAQSYIRWLNEKVRGPAPPPPLDAPSAPVVTGPYRLLSEAEWEYAARAGADTTYYWGDTAGVGNANCDGCGSQWDNKQTSPVGSFAPNKFGLYDMAGNVLQWVQDCYHDSYAGAPVDGSAWVKGGCNIRMLRGGSWYNSTYYLRAANRYSNAPYFRGVNIGFRVARTLDEPAKP